MSLAFNALNNAANEHRFNFDAQSYSIRKNLMVASSLSIALTFVSPLEGTGKYAVNLGFLKGDIDNPVLIYIFLAITCGYYLVWFYIHCKSITVKNYSTIRRSFVSSLAVQHARDKFKKFTLEYEPKYTSIPNFTPGGGSGDSWFVFARIGDIKLRYPDFIKNLCDNSEFSVTTEKEGFQIKYSHTPSDRDLIFLSCHIDKFWRVKKEVLVVTVLPIAYATFSIILIVAHIWGLTSIN